MCLMLKGILHLVYGLMMLSNKNKYLVEFEELCTLSVPGGFEKVVSVLFDCPCCKIKSVSTSIVNESINHRFNNGNAPFSCIACGSKFSLDSIGDEYMLWRVMLWDS